MCNVYYITAPLILVNKVTYLTYCLGDAGACNHTSMLFVCESLLRVTCSRPSPRRSVSSRVFLAFLLRVYISMYQFRIYGVIICYRATLSVSAVFAVSVGVRPSVCP